MKTSFLVTLLLIVFSSINYSFAQFGSKIKFTPLRNTEVEQLRDPAITVGDIDNDQDLDMIITGNPNLPNVNQSTRFYINDGTGHFDSYGDGSVPGRRIGTSLQLGDLEGDNDLDLLVTGISNGSPYTTYHRNLSPQDFSSRLINMPFASMAYGTTSIVDVDGDNDLDVFLTGRDNSTSFANLYKNSGFGTFTLSVTPSITSVSNSATAFFDFDGDGDQDLLISGEDANGNTSIRRYYNNGNGGFQFVSSSMAAVKNGDISVADFDGDSDLDIFVTGVTQNGIHTSFIYFNNGNGVFTFSNASTNFAQVSHSSSDTLDYDKDGDIDIILSGELSSGTKITHLYRNDGNGVFQQLINFNGVSNGFSKAFDMNQDGYMDVIFGGESNFSNPAYLTQIFFNNQNGSFVSASGPEFTGISNSIGFMTDVNLDNRLDYFQSGIDKNVNVSFEAYVNDLQNNNDYTRYSTSFIDVSNGAYFKADFNQDGRDDFIICGYDASSNAPATRLYSQTGALSYSSITGLPFDDFAEASIAAADIDGDNDLDVVISGNLAGGFRSTKLYTSNGGFNYSNSNQTLIDLANGSVEFADIDGDNDQDLYITGRNQSGDKQVKVYQNDGFGQFAPLNGLPFDSISSSQAEFKDIDGDGDLDLVCVGQDNSNNEVSHIYINNGSGSFTEKMNTGILGIYNGSMKIHDFDQDSDLDILLTGNGRNPMNYVVDTTVLYINDGNGNFAKAQTSFPNLSDGSIAVGDVNNDTKDDVILTGFRPRPVRGADDEVALLFINNSCSYTKTTLNRTLCNSFTSFSGKTWTESGTYFDTLSLGNCGIIYTFNLIIDTNTTANISDTVCANYISPSGKLITETGIYFDTIPNNLGCDSILNIDLTVLQTDTLIEDTVCNQYTTTTGKLISISGTYFDTIPNSVNCDSIIEYHITISQNDTTLNESACNQYTSPSGKLFNQSGQFKDTLTNIFNCDSIITINLNIYLSNDTLIRDSACYNYISPSGLLWDSSGIFHDTIPTTRGCDSAMTFDLIIYKTTYDTTSTSACRFYLSPSGKLLTQSGQYQDTIQNTNNCDSIITVNLSILQSDTSFTVNSCSSFTSPSGKVWTSTGNYLDTIPNQSGCDSIMNIQLNLLNSDTTLNIRYCKEYTSPAGNIYKNSGQFIETIPNQHGCDSIITINLTIYLAQSNIDTTTCERYISPSGRVLFSSGIYYDSLTNNIGCDSLVIIDLTIKNNSTSQQTISSCGPFTSASGRIFTQSGTYSDTIINQAGCDSILNYHLTINMESRSSQNITACKFYTLPSGNVVSNSGVYQEILSNSSGCDSIITINLNLITPDTSISKQQDTLTLGSTNAFQYQWLSCDYDTIIQGANQRRYIVSRNGRYAGIIEEDNCKDTSRCVRVTSIGLAENQLKSGFHLYPNPTSNNVTIEFDNWNASSHEAIIITPQGKVLKHITLKSKVSRIQLSELSKGFYFIKIGMIKKKIVII